MKLNLADDDNNPYNPSGFDIKSSGRSVPEQKTFQDTWGQVKDTRKYANVLTRYDKLAQESRRHSETELERVSQSVYLRLVDQHLECR